MAGYATCSTRTPTPPTSGCSDPTRPPPTASTRCSTPPGAPGRGRPNPIDDGLHLQPGGRVMEILSEHTCHGWLEGYLLTGRHGLFSCYEAFIHIVGSMVNQHAKWLKVSAELDWRSRLADRHGRRDRDPVEPRPLRPDPRSKGLPGHTPPRRPRLRSLVTANGPRAVGAHRLPNRLTPGSQPPARTSTARSARGRPLVQRPVPLATTHAASQVESASPAAASSSSSSTTSSPSSTRTSFGPTTLSRRTGRRIATPPVMRHDDWCPLRKERP